MQTPPLSQNTSATVSVVPQLDRDGSEALVVLIKQRFRMLPAGRVERDSGAEVRLSDVPWDKDAPEKSSVRYPADICLRKPSTDVLVSGAAVAPGRVPAKSLDVAIRVGPVSTQLRVFGLRVWYRGFTGLALSEARSFEEVPLRWELAYGGFDTSDPQDPLEEPRNPVGRGLARQSATLLNTPAPAIEDPEDLIRSHRSRPAPAGVGPLGRHWMPRRSFVGTMDERWKRERLPLLPVDFDDRHNQLAPPKLIAPAPLRGGEPVELMNLSEDGLLRFTLPKLAFFIGTRNAQGMTEHRSMLDTVLFEPNQKRFDMTWRSTMPWPGGRQQLLGVQVHEKEFR